jgi:hypothetical protein
MTESLRRAYHRRTGLPAKVLEAEAQAGAERSYTQEPKGK